MKDLEKVTDLNFSEKITPDIIIDYMPLNEDFMPVAVIYVRPETNQVSYEKAILKGALPYSDVIFMANLNGMLFIRDALILDHYACQYRFAIYGVDEIKKYPEMVDKVENYFGVHLSPEKFIGSFDAILKLNISAEKLFNTFVDEKSFLKLYGQTIKKYDDLYIINYDLPAIIEKYNDKSNVFIVVVKFKNEKITFDKINYSIAIEMEKDNNLLFYCADIYKDISLIEKVKRTYHFSSTHIMAMFDMTDFVFDSNCKRISVTETPFGHYLIKNNFLTKERLIKLREYPMVYVSVNGKRELLNIIEDTKGISFDESVELLRSIE